MKEYEAPRRLPAYLLIDTSASMTIRSTKHSKYGTYIFIAKAVWQAQACHSHRISPVGMLGVGESTLHVRPSLSRETVLGWLHRLRFSGNSRRASPVLLQPRRARPTPQLSERTLLIVLSDLHEPQAIPVLKKAWLQKRGCVVASGSSVRPNVVHPSSAGGFLARR